MTFRQLRAKYGLLTALSMVGLVLASGYEAIWKGGYAQGTYLLVVCMFVMQLGRSGDR